MLHSVSVRERICKVNNDTNLADQYSQFVNVVNDDVFNLIAIRMLEVRGSLAKFALTSHLVRRLCAPHLFARCAAHPRGLSGVPPTALRPFVRSVYRVSYIVLHTDRNP